MTAVTSLEDLSGRIVAASGDDSFSAILRSEGFEELFERDEDALVAFDNSGRLVAANHASERLFGYQPGELSGCAMSALFSDGFDLAEALSSTSAAAPVRLAALGTGGERALLAPLSVKGVRKSGIRVPISLSLIRIAGSEESVVLAVMRESTAPAAVANSTGLLGTEATGRDMLALQRELLVEVARGNGVGGIAGALHARTGRNVLILDRAGHVMASAGYTDEDPAPTGPVNVLRGDAPHAVRQRHGDWWTAAARPDRELLGSIAIFDPAKDLPESDQLALEQAISILSAELLQYNGTAEPAAADWDAFANELLGGRDHELLGIRARAHGYELDRAHRAVAVQAPGIGPEGVTVIEQVLRNTGVRTPLVTARSDHIIFITADDLPWEQVGSALNGAMGEGARIGVGGVYQVSDLSRSHTEAIMALELGATVNSDNTVTTFGDLGVWGFLVDSQQPGKLRDLVEEWIGTLIEVDRLHGSELVKTLTNYLKESCATETTATSLHIHRNTLRYRLTKIAAITGHNLGDADQRFHLELACRAWTVLQALEAARVVSPNRDQIRQRARW
jgi:PAS domain-containing protein